MISASPRCEGDRSDFEDPSIIEASFSDPSEVHCVGCGARCALQVSASGSFCPVLIARKLVDDGELSSSDIVMPSPPRPMSSSSSPSLLSVSVPRAIEVGLPSYYEHLSVSLLVPETPEDGDQAEQTPPGVTLAGGRRRTPRPLSPALPLPDHMAPLGDFLDGVTAYVEVRSDLGDHSGAVAALLFRMGASIAATLTSTVTHAVLSDARPGSIRRAQSLGIQMVAARWAMACKDQLRRVEEDQWPVVSHTTQDEQRRVRQYRYKTNMMRETPSPVSVRNLARLSKLRRRDTGFTSSESELDADADSSSQKDRNSPGGSSPRLRVVNKWMSPRKSLRRMLFKHPNPSHPEINSEDSDTGPVEEITSNNRASLEVPETQTLPPLCFSHPDMPIPETDPLLWSTQAREDSDYLEVPETQPEASNGQQKPSDASGSPQKDLNESPPSLDTNTTVVEVNKQMRRKKSCFQTLDLAQVHAAEDSRSIETSFGQLNVSGDSLKEKFKKDPQNKYSPEIVDSLASQEISKLLSELSISTNNSDIKSMDSPLDLVLPQGLSQCRVSSCPKSGVPEPAPKSASQNSDKVNWEYGALLDEPESEAQVDKVSLVSHRHVKAADESTTDNSGDGQIFHRCANGAVSEEIGLIIDDFVSEGPNQQHNSSSNIRERPNGQGEPANSPEESPFIFTENSERQKLNIKVTETHDKANDLPQANSLELLEPAEPHSLSNIVTPITVKRTRASNVFSDDESPCMDARKTVVLTAVKNKAILIKNLSALANKILRRGSGDRPTDDGLPPLVVATQVTTKTEVVVLERRKRTLAVLLGISWGCWFVSVRWVSACVKAGQWLNPAPFEIRDYLSTMVSNRTARCRGDRPFENEPLKGVAVFISRRRPLSPPAETLQRMVLQAAGKVVYDVGRADVYVGRCRPTKKLQCSCVTPAWIIETIASGTKQDENNFIL